MSAGGEREAYDIVSARETFAFGSGSFRRANEGFFDGTGRASAQEVGCEDSQWRLLRWVGRPKREWKFW